MHIYAFGSICRGDISPDSDVDILALSEGHDTRLSSDRFSIYSYKRITELWQAGNAFAWHLSLESKLIYSEDGVDFIKDLGSPSAYTRAADDCARFSAILDDALACIKRGTPSLVFELSTVFLALRNIATCYSLATSSTPTFSRHSARRIGPRNAPVSNGIYDLLMRSRILSTRGIGEDVGDIDLESLIFELERCRDWAHGILWEVSADG